MLRFNKNSPERAKCKCRTGRKTQCRRVILALQNSSCILLFITVVDLNYLKWTSVRPARRFSDLEASATFASLVFQLIYVVMDQSSNTGIITIKYTYLYLTEYTYS